MRLRIDHVLVLSWISAIQAIAIPQSLSVTINLNKASHVLDQHFVSFSVNPTDLLKGKPFGMKSNATFEIVKELSPTYIRLGGPDTNSYIFQTDLHNHDGTVSADQIIVTESHWKELNDMLRAAGVDIIVCLNGAHTNGDKWNPKNSQELIAYSEKHNYNITWQLGYEPARSGEIKGEELGKDISKLRDILNEFQLNKRAKIIGPDIRSIHRQEDEDYITDALVEASSALNGITWHPRWPRVSAVRLTDGPEEGYDFPPDYLEWDWNQLNKILHRTLINKPLWIGEPAGENSGSFAEGLIWARRLAIAARLGVEVVMKQPSLNDITHPKPEYWVALLHKKMLGQTVLDTHSFSNQSDISMTVQCASRKYKPEDGGITIFAINAAGSSRRADFWAMGMFNDAEKEAHQYILTSDDIFSQITYLNGEPLLTNENGSLPTLVPKVLHLRGNLMIKLPPYSIGFWVIPQAKARICQQEPEPIAAPKLNELSAKVLQTTQKGVNALRNMNHLIVEQFFHPLSSEEDIVGGSKEAGNGNKNKELKRPNRETVYTDIEDEINHRVQEINDLLKFNLKGLNKYNIRSDVGENELRATDTKIEELAKDLKTIINEADQQREFSRFLDVSGLKEDFGKKMMEERLERVKSKGTDVNELKDNEFEDSNEGKLEKERLKRETNKEDESNFIRKLTETYKQNLADQLKLLKSYPNTFTTGDFGKINKEFQEEMLLKEISMLEKREEQVLAAMEAHKKQHELMDKLIKEEVTHLKENKIAALLDIKTDGLELDQDKEKDMESNKPQYLTNKRHADNSNAEHPLTPKRNIFKINRGKNDHLLALQEKLRDLHKTLLKEKSTRKHGTSTTPEMTTFDPSTESTIITEPEIHVQTHDQQRREEMLKSMSDVIEMEEKSADNQDLQSKVVGSTTKRNPRTVKEATTNDNLKPNQMYEESKELNEDNLKEASVLLKRLLETEPEENDNETEELGVKAVTTNKKDGDGFNEPNNTLLDNEINHILNGTNSVKDLAEQVKKFRDGRNTQGNDKSSKPRGGNAEGEKESATTSLASKPQARQIKSSDSEKNSYQTEVSDKASTVSEDKQFGKSAPVSSSQSEYKSAINEISYTSSKPRQKRDAHDVKYGFPHTPQGTAQDVRESQDILRNSIIKMKFLNDNETTDTTVNNSIALKPEQYLQLADTTMRIVLNDVIPEAYDKAKGKLEEINLPGYLKKWNNMVDNLQTLEKVLKVVTKNIPAVGEVSESIQKIERKKRNAINKQNITELLPSNHITEFDQLGSDDEKINKEITEQKVIEQPISTAQDTNQNKIDNITNNLPIEENDLVPQFTTDKPLEATTPIPSTVTDEEMETSNYTIPEIPEDILTQSLLNEAVAELVEEIFKKGESEVERDIQQMELKSNKGINNDVNNNLHRKDHVHPLEDDDPSTPWLTSANRMIDELIENLQKQQMTEQPSIKGKRETDTRFQQLKGSTNDDLQIQNNDNFNEFLRNLRPGVYVVPSEDMTNVHADQSFKHIPGKKIGKNVPNVVTLNIYYDKKEDEKSRVEPDVSQSEPMPLNSNSKTSIPLRPPLSNSYQESQGATTWPTIGTYKSGLPTLSSGPRDNLQTLSSLPRTSSQALPIFDARATPHVPPTLGFPRPSMASIPKQTPSVHPLLGKKALQDTLYQVQKAVGTLQETVPAYLPPATNSMIYQSPREKPMPKYDERYSIVKQDVKPNAVKIDPSTSPWVTNPAVEVEQYQWPDDSDKLPDNINVNDQPDNTWYVHKTINEPRFYVKKDLSKNHPLSSVEKLKSIEPYWNRTLREIFQETYNDPFWTFIKKDRASSAEESNIAEDLPKEEKKDTQKNVEDEKKIKGQESRRRRSVLRKNTHQIRKRALGNIMDWDMITASLDDNPNLNDMTYPRIRRDHRMLLNNVIVKKKPNNQLLLDSDRVLHDFLPKKQLKHITDPDSSLEVGQRLDEIILDNKLGSRPLQHRSNRLSELAKKVEDNSLNKIMIHVEAPQESAGEQPGEYSKMTIEIPGVGMNEKELTSQVLNKRRHLLPDDNVVDPLQTAYEAAVGLFNNMFV